jgi:ribosomal protein S18 acetylase RimI-like enzyme
MGTRMNGNVRFDPVGEADFPTIARLGEAIWREYYPSMISLAQIDYMLAGRFAPERLRQYANAQDRGLFLVRIDGEPAGYFSYALTSNPAEMKLEQLYLLERYRGQGVGKRMLGAVEAQANAHGCRALILTVNKGNAGAIAIYRKAGFTVREAAVFDIGNGYVMDDYVMHKTLA